MGKLVDLHNELSQERLLGSAARTTTVNGSAVDLLNYDGSIKAVLESAAGTGTSPTMDVKIQDSADGSTGWADVSGATFTQVTTAVSLQSLSLNTRGMKRYIRAVATIGGTTPSFTCNAIAIGQKKVI